MDQEPKGREKRQYERVRISKSRQLWNLSEGGAYIATGSPRRLGSLVHFEFRMEKGQIFQALGKVVRVLHKPNLKIGEPAGMAIEFVKVSDNDLFNLRLYLSDRIEEREFASFNEEI